jgi:hypothetical protein
MTTTSNIINLATQIVDLIPPGNEESNTRAHTLLKKLENDLIHFEHQIEQFTLLKLKTGVEINQIVENGVSEITTTSMEKKKSRVAIGFNRIPTLYHVPLDNNNQTTNDPNRISTSSSNNYSTNTTTKRKGYYRPFIVHPHLEIIDSRDTVGRFIFGEGGSRIIFKLYRNSVVTTVLFIMFVISLYGGCASIPGFRPDDGYLAFLGLPGTIFITLMFNRYLVVRVLREPETWSLLVLFGLIIGSLFDMLRDQPIRQCAVVSTFPFIIVIFYDARPFQKKSTINYLHALILVGTISPFYLALTYYVGGFGNFHQSSIDISDVISLHIPTICIGALQTFSLLAAKYFYFMVFERKIPNALILIRAHCFFEYHLEDQDNNNNMNDNSTTTSLPGLSFITTNSAISNKNINTSSIVSSVQQVVGG